MVGVNGLTVLGLALTAGLADLVGGYLTVARGVTPAAIGRFVALGAGFLLGAAFFDILPEAVRATPEAPLYIAAGYFAIYLLEHVFARGAHHHGGLEATEEHCRTPHALVGEPHAGEPLISPAASVAALLGLILHTFFDGAAIAVGFLGGDRLGILVFVAVILHKLPEGFSLSSIMLAAAQGRARALLATLAIAVSTVVGSVATLVLRETNPGSTGVFLALATGTFFYVGASDLIPATTGRRKDQVALVLVGALAVLGLATLLKALGVE